MVVPNEQFIRRVQERTGVTDFRECFFYIWKNAKQNAHTKIQRKNASREP